MKNQKFINFLVFLVAVCANQPNSSSISYFFEGQCEGDFICLPYSNISFKSIWNTSQQELLIQLNQELTKNSNLSDKIEFRKSKFKEAEIGLFAKESISKDELLAVFSTNSLFSTSIDFSNFNNKTYYQEHSLYPSLQFKANQENSLRFAINLIYHIYHYEDSNLKLLIQSLPQKPNIPLFTSSEYEANLLQHDPAFEFLHFLGLLKNYFRLLYKIREKCLADYSILFSRMKAKWTTQQINSFLNGRDFIPLDDFVYAYFIYLAKSLTVKINENEMLDFIAPFISNILFNTKNMSDILQNNIQYDNQSGLVRFYSNNNYLQNEEIFYKFENNNFRYLFLVYGAFIENGPQDCFDLTFLTEEQSELIGLKSTECVSIQRQELLKYFISCCLANMEIKDSQMCQEQIIPAKPDLQKMYNIMIEKCKITSWGQFDFFKNPKIHLNDTITQLEANIMKAKECRVRRHIESRDRKNSNLLLKYLQEKAKIAKSLLNKIEELYNVIPKDQQKSQINKEQNEEIIDLDIDNSNKEQINYEL